MSFLPGVSAQPPTLFPNVSFNAFSKVILSTFNADISLETVLFLLFSLLENPELLNLHGRQKNQQLYGEKSTIATGWLKIFAYIFVNELGNSPEILFPNKEYIENHWESDLARKFDTLINFLGLSPYNHNGDFEGKLSRISQQGIAPVQIICPTTMVCTTNICQPFHLSLHSKKRDVPKVILIKGSTCIAKAYSLIGQCDKCKTIYTADHESYSDPINKETQKTLFINSAKYLKVGSNIWVDRVFSNALLNGIYSFHASASAYTQYWNNSFMDAGSKKHLGRKQVWQTFIQESIRSIAKSSNIDFEIDSKLAIDEVTEQAFNILGENGLIRVADGHSCSDCTKLYKKTVDDPGNKDAAPVKMIVLDGIVMGPTVSCSVIVSLSLN